MNYSGKPDRLHSVLSGKWEEGTRPKDLFALHVEKDPGKFVKVILDGLDSGNSRVANGCAELASLVSEEYPELLYPHVEVFLVGLESSKKIIRWEAACTLGNLARVDDHGQVHAAIPRLTEFLNEKSIVLKGHSLRALAKIAGADACVAGSILDTIYETAPTFTKNKIGFVIECMEHFLPHTELRDRILDFVTPFENSEINVVAKKAKRILKKMK